MKILLFLSALIISSNYIFAQPCKLVKPGMDTAKVLELVGEPDEKLVLGHDNGVEIAVWHYGNQRVTFSGGVVEEVIADAKNYDELVQLYARKELTHDQFSARLQELNRVACK